jgi:hypothetical protein
MAPKRQSASKVKRKPRSERFVRLPAEYFEAMDMCHVLFPMLYQFENGLRLALNSFLTTCYGSDWWRVSLKLKLQPIFEYAENQQKKLDLMPWIGSSTVVEVLPIHLVTLGQLEEIVKAYKSECIPQLFPNLEFFLGHMELIKRVRNMYSHMFPCISRSDCQFAQSEIRILAAHINSKLSPRVSSAP